MSEKITRRTFTKAGMASTLGLTAAQASRVPGANDRVRLGWIGVGSRGGQLLDAFVQHADAQVVAMCDVSKSTLDAANQKWASGKAATCGDFRKLIDRKDIDAVVIATPDHWHAIQTIAATSAGKDVYCEKPLSKTIYEGRRMVEAARRNHRVVQVGTHRRSGHSYAEAAKFIASGKLGKVTLGRAFDTTNMFPDGIGRSKPSDPPKDLDWDMWLGPRPPRPYQDNITPFKFRWWHLYSTRYADNGVHFLDIIRWLSGDEPAPESICAMGGKFAVNDDRTIPDVMEGMFRFASGRLVIFGQYETSGNRALPRQAFAEFRGTQGALYVSDAGFEVLPEHGGRYQYDRFTTSPPRMQPIKREFPGGYSQHIHDHTRNFLDCIKSRAKPRADVEIGHRSTTMSLLAHISLVTESLLQWDAQRELVTNVPQANEMLHYEYRKPWRLE
jgi:predicted dehydrogenase